MRVLAALDSFKGAFSSREANAAVARGLAAGWPAGALPEIETTPISDGGEGFIEAIREACGGEVIRSACRDPRCEPMEAEFLLTALPGEAGGKTAVLEAAATCGLSLLSPEHRNPLGLVSCGLGEQLRAALESGAERILLGVGGTATNDGGAGAAMALGARFFNARGEKVFPVGGALREVTAVNRLFFNRRVKEACFEVACDVDNPLTGEHGAARTFAAQKGADVAGIERLEEGLDNLASLVERDLQMSARDLPGSGAGGGLAWGLAVFCKAKLRPGLSLFAEVVGLEEKIKRADLVVTGEGRMDAQTLRGKAPLGVAEFARRYNVPVVAFCGVLNDPGNRLQPKPFAKIHDLASAAGSSEAALAGGAELLERTARKKAVEIAALL